MDAPVDYPVLVHCPKCDERATISAHLGFLRLACPACGYVHGGPEHGRGRAPPRPAAFGRLALRASPLNDGVGHTRTQPADLRWIRRGTEKLVGVRVLD